MNGLVLEELVRTVSGYGIDDVPSVTLSDEQSTLLKDQDSSQAELMAEKVILVDENDNIIGSDSKIDTHHDVGKLHRAFSVLLFNSEGKLLLQRRALDKVTFPGVWANTCCSHPLASEEEMNPNDYIGTKIAAVRKMEQELGISPSQISTDDFHFVTKMLYQARMNPDWIERELDHILVIKADVELDPNPNEVSEIKWVNAEELQDMISKQTEETGFIAPWFRCIAEDIMTENWWKAGFAGTGLEDLEDGKIHDMGDVTFLLPNAEPASYKTSLLEVMPAVEKRIETSLRNTSHKRLSDAMMHLIEGGGKRMRASLPWLVANATGRSHSGIIDVGSVIEIIHNFTLVHDDIMDDDDIRRGRNAVHIEYDMPTAINAGDAMLAIAFETLYDAKNISTEDTVTIFKKIAWMVRRVSEGQQLDIEFEDREIVEEDEYIEMILGKTSVMFIVCAEIGAFLSGSSQEVVKMMAKWGENTGLCFQLMDDIIDIMSSTEELGKPAGSDIVQGKKTLMAIHALRQPDSPAKQAFLAAYNKGDDCPKEIRDAAHDALYELGSVEYAKQRAVEYHSAAHDILNQLPQRPGLDVLRELTDIQLKRMV
tara:strand:- start:10377 stop:12164 length:1788 start_codon:yes stop_codon:yes gene_type:complete